MKLTRSSLFLSLVAFPVILFSQVINGSFEIGGQPSLSGWRFTCTGNESFHDSPFDTSGWCLTLICGNYQSCFPGLAYQIVEGVKSGEIWQLDAWTKRDVNSLLRSIYWKIFNVGGGSVNLAKDTTSSAGWVHLTVRDTIFINQGDSVAVVLDAGSTGGPHNGWSYFDLVSANKVGSTGIISEHFNEYAPKTFTLFQNYPNPFNPSTTFRFMLPKEDFVNLKIYGSLGQEIATLLNLHLPSGEHFLQWNAANISSGNYFYRLQGSNYTETKKLVLLR